MITGPQAVYALRPTPELYTPAKNLRGEDTKYPVIEDLVPGAEVYGWWNGRWYRLKDLDRAGWSRIEHFRADIALHSSWLLHQWVGSTTTQYTVKAGSEVVGNPEYAYLPREWLIEYGRTLLKAAEARGELREGFADQATWYQAAAAALGATRPWAFLRWAPGGGKTAGAVCAALSRLGATLICCPAKARKEWTTRPGRRRTSMEKFTHLESHVMLPKSERGVRYEDLPAYLYRMQREGRRPLVVVGQEALPDYLEELTAFTPAILIIDELHEFGDSKRWEVFATQQGGVAFEEATTTNGAVKRATAIMQIAHSRDLVLRVGLTGTPMDDGRPRRMWAPLDLLSPGGFGRNQSFRMRYTGMCLDEQGYVDDEGSANIGELKQRCAMFMLDLSRAETHAALPAMRLEVSYLAPPDALHVPETERQNKPDSFAAEMKRAAKAAQQGGTEGEHAKANQREVGLAEAASRKRRAVRLRAKEFLDSGGKVVVLVARIQLAEKWAEQWRESFPGVTNWLATGNVSEAERDRIVDAYAEHPGPCWIIGTGQSIGTSKDGMQHTDLATVAQLPDKPGTLLQWIGRFDRLGGRSPIVWIPVAEGSKDDQEIARLTRKSGTLEKFLDAPEIRELTRKLGGLDDPDLIASTLSKIGGEDWVDDD